MESFAKKLKNVFPEWKHDLALGEGDLFPECHALTLGEGASSPRATVPALGEGPLPRVPTKALGDLFLFFLFFCPIFCEAFPHHFKILSQIWITFDFLLYFVSFFPFLEFLGTLQIWSTGTWKHIIWRFKQWYSWYLVYIEVISSNSHEMSSILLSIVTWRITYGKSASKLQKIRTKSENHETCRGVGCLKPKHFQVCYHIDHMWRCIGFRHQTSQLARNLFNCSPRWTHSICALYPVNLLANWWSVVSFSRVPWLYA
jgi:hypothetical protein